MKHLKYKLTATLFGLALAATGAQAQVVTIATRLQRLPMKMASRRVPSLWWAICP